MKLSNRISIKFILFSLLLLQCKQQALFGQELTNSAREDSTSKIREWLVGLYEQGVGESGDSIILSPEVLRLLNDEDYRKQFYPQTYSWEKVARYVQEKDLRKAFWHMINLYMVNDENKNITVKSFITYDGVFKMDKILTGTFYTYIFADPEINTITDGMATVVAPHKMEAKLKALSDILGYLDQARASTARKAEEKSGQR